jgi:hypothetical protein
VIDLDYPPDQAGDSQPSIIRISFDCDSGNAMPAMPLFAKYLIVSEIQIVALWQGSVGWVQR